MPSSRGRGSGTIPYAALPQVEAVAHSSPEPVVAAGEEEAACPPAAAGEEMMAMVSCHHCPRVYAMIDILQQIEYFEIFFKHILSVH